jgi:hypothetical protein
MAWLAGWGTRCLEWIEIQAIFKHDMDMALRVNRHDTRIEK